MKIFLNAAILTLICMQQLIAQNHGDELYVVEAQLRPIIAMHKIPNSREVTDADLEKLVSIEIQWNNHEAKELARLRRLSSLKEIHVGYCNLRFESLKYLEGIPLNGLFAGSRCELTPKNLHLLTLFPNLERLEIDFGLDGIEQTMKAIELPQLEVLRQLPKLREIHAAGWGLTTVALPRFSNHPNLEVLHFGPSSVGVHGKMMLTGLPKLKSLKLPKIADEHIEAVLGLPTLEALEADAEELSIHGFAALNSLANLKKLALEKFWTPGNALQFLRSLDKYTSAEIQAVVGVQSLQLVLDREREYEQTRQMVSLYAPLMVGTVEQRALEPWRNDALKLVRETLGECNSTESFRRTVSGRILELASDSDKEGFYDSVHRAVERLAGMKFSKKSRSKSSGKPLQSQPAKTNNTDSIENSIGMRFNLVPAGAFAHVDDNGGSSSASVSQPFYLGIYEVTQSQFSQVMGKNTNSLAPVKQHVGDLLPETHVTTGLGLAFCHKLGELPAEKQARRQYRLPTEHEWELACRAGSTSRFSFGEVGDCTPQVANLATQPSINPFQAAGQPRNVGSYPPNALGLFDMHGNVCELCMDAHGPWESKTPDFVRLRKEVGINIFRGGDYATEPSATGSSYRSRYHEYVGDIAMPQMGLRVVCVIEPSSALSKKILESQFEICDPKTRESNWAKQTIEESSKKIQAGDQTSYVDRAKAYCQLGVLSENPSKFFDLAKDDLITYRKQGGKWHHEVEFGEEVRDLANEAGERFAQDQQPDKARHWWETSLRASELVYQQHVSQALASTESTTKEQHQSQAAYAVMLLTQTLEKLDRHQEAVDRLTSEIANYPKHTGLYKRRAEIKLSRKDFTGAVEDMRLAIRANPERFELALKQYHNSRSTSSLAYHSDLINQLADMLEQRGDSDLANRQRQAIAKLKQGKLEIVE